MPGGCREIGKWLLKILAEFYMVDKDMTGDEDEAQPGGSQRGSFSTSYDDEC